jgi:transglutaminase-like putative cysteine protease
LRALFDRDYNYTELLTWEHQRLNYTDEPSITRNTDPMKILDYGKGRCQEFSLLYVALCLANGYESRFVIDVYGDHTWAEVKLQGVWVHVDPSDQIVNDPYRYERDWHKDLPLVLAFENSSCEDVTTNYKMKNQDSIIVVI